MSRKGIVLDCCKNNNFIFSASIGKLNLSRVPAFFCAIIYQVTSPFHFCFFKFARAFYSIPALFITRKLLAI